MSLPVTLNMATAAEQAVALKNEGNTAFAAHNWEKAIDCYTKAIELDDKQPTYYSNRAQVSSQSLFNTCSCD